jgi:hypothetical protein
MLGLLQSQMNNETGPDRFAHVDLFLRSVLGNETYQMNSFGFHIVAHPNLPLPFALDHVINGSMFHSDRQFSLAGYVFDFTRFLTAARLFGVLTGFSIVLTYAGWRSILRRFRSARELSQLSLHSFIWHYSIEFAYGIFIFSQHGLSSELDSMFFFLFAVQIFVYSTTQTGVLVMIWRSSIHDQLNSMVYILFVAEVSVILTIAPICLSFVFVKPVLPLFFLYSYAVPQIVHNCRHAYKSRPDTLFILLVTAARVIPLLYFGVYKGNFENVCAPGLVAGILLWIAIQMAVLLCQNAFGSAAFLPRRWAPRAYDYFRDAPEEGDCAICMSGMEGRTDIMVTPCGHAFHGQCLVTWMNERLVCPICRAPLPEIQDV